MFITKKHLSRRTFLRGAGVTLGLPFLESMVGAQTLLRNSAAAPKTRLGCFYVPHGATMYKWTPATEGKGFSLSETLTPLEKYRDRLTVVSNLFHASATGADAGAEHARSAAIFLSGGQAAEECRPRRGHDGSDRGAAHRSGHAAAVDRAGHRGRQPELRRGLRLRVLQHHFLAHADGPVAGGEQSAGGVREAVRRRRHDRAAPRPQTRGSEHSRFDPRADAGAAEGAPRLGPPARRRLSRRHPRDRAPHQDRARPQRAPGRIRERARRAGRHAGSVRGSPEADVRPADPGVSERNDPRRDVDVRQGSQPCELPGERQPRRVSRRHPSRERTRADGSVRPDQQVSRPDARRISSASSPGPPTATARCSITR